MVRLCAEHDGIDGNHCGLKRQPIHRRALLGEILNNVGVGDHQWEFAGGRQLSAHGAPAHHHRFLFGEFF